MLAPAPESFSLAGLFLVAHSLESTDSEGLLRGQPESTRRLVRGWGRLRGNAVSGGPVPLSPSGEADAI